MSAEPRHAARNLIVPSVPADDGDVEHLRPAAYPPGDYVGQQSFMSAAEILTLARVAGVGPGANVLDLCCGRGGPACYLARETGGSIIGIDRTWPAVEAARQAAHGLNAETRPRFLVADASQIPCATTFDVVLLLETMLAFADKERLLHEIGRVIRPGGRLGLTIEEGAPLTPAERRGMPDGDDIWLIGVRDFLTATRRAGFALRWLADFTGAHATVASRLATTFRRHRRTLLSRIGDTDYARLIAAHDRWARWLEVRRVRKLAIVLERR